MTSAYPTLRISAAGDALVHQVTLDAHTRADGTPDFAGLLTPYRRILTASHLNIYNQETPLTADPARVRATQLDPSIPPVYVAPARLAHDLAAAGFNAASTATNHTLDDGTRGVHETRDILHDAGIAIAGPNPDDPQAHGSMFDVGPYTIAHFSYTFTPNNHATTLPPPDALYTTPTLWPLRGAQGVLDDAHTARTQGANVVIVSIHWGGGYDTPTPTMRDLAHTLLSDGAIDWITGNHPHVIQPIERINGRYVTYSHGNLFTGRDPDDHPNRPDLHAVTHLDLTITPGQATHRTMSTTITKTTHPTPRLVTPTRADMAWATRVLGAYGHDTPTRP